MKRNKFKKSPQRNGNTIIGVVILSLVIIIGIALAIHYLPLHKTTSENNETASINSSFDSLPETVAKINGKTISRDEFKRTFYLMLYLNNVPKSAESTIPKSIILNQSIIQTILVDKARSEGFNQSAEKTEEDFAKVLSLNNLTIEGFKQEISGKDFSFEDFINFYNEQAIINDFFNKTILSKISVSDEDARKYYNENKAQFIVPERVRASHILVNSSEEAEMIIKKLGEGISFSELAKNYSIGPSGPKGGDLGFFARGQMVPEFENATFALKKIGDYTTTPVKTQFGYHVILLTGKENASTLSFEEVKDKLKEELVQKQAGETINKFIKELYNKSNVEIFIPIDKQQLPTNN
jgi:parvulin-like peptidyl-prolyl isomerase